MRSSIAITGKVQGKASSCDASPHLEMRRSNAGQQRRIPTLSIWKDYAMPHPDFSGTSTRSGTDIFLHQLAKSRWATRILVVTFCRRSRLLCVKTWTRTPTSTRVAVPFEGNRRRPDNSETNRATCLLRLISGPAQQGQVGNIKPKNMGTHPPCGSSTNTTFGAWREKAKSCSRAKMRWKK